MNKMKSPTITCTFTPGLRVSDPLTTYWLRQATLRLRRELCWQWQEQGVLPGLSSGTLPTFRDRVSATLEQQRFWEQKQLFFQTDETAKYLSDQIETDPVDFNCNAEIRGSFAWVVQTMALSRAETFVLALGLLAAYDNSAGSVIGACLNDQNQTLPNLALAQTLWEEPEALLTLGNLSHPLFSYGLLGTAHHVTPETKLYWDLSVAVPSLLALQLLFPCQGMIKGLKLLEPEERNIEDNNKNIRLLSSCLTHEKEKNMRIVPVKGPLGAPCYEVVQAIAHRTKQDVAVFTSDPSFLRNNAYLSILATYCWLRGISLFLDHHQVNAIIGEKLSMEIDRLPNLSIPVTIFCGISDRKQVSKLPGNHVLPLIETTEFTYVERKKHWQVLLGQKSQGLEQSISDCSRRFRFQKKTIETICQRLKDLPGNITRKDLLLACRAEVEFDISEISQEVEPRFQDEKLILSEKHTQQFQEIVHAMRALTEVHYEWGTGKVWNEGGIAVLFAGPPGTGKTMAAEVLAIKLELPMYRIDLSQVVSKYIGETEKNLKRLFDAADISDTILFFDEADSLFGRRTEVKDAHDRYANLEISYLLERMERFKGLAILASNRKKDLDEAFLRRLRYIVDFSLPNESERKRIWDQVIPQTVDRSDLDIDFLARQFSLAGGHIRSIVFNACLQSANGRQNRKGMFKGHLSMENVIIAIKREYEKLNRTTSLEHYGPYAHIVERMEDRNASG